MNKGNFEKTHEICTCCICTGGGGVVCQQYRERRRRKIFRSSCVHVHFEISFKGVSKAQTQVRSGNGRFPRSGCVHVHSGVIFRGLSRVQTKVQPGRLLVRSGKNSAFLWFFLSQWHRFAGKSPLLSSISVWLHPDPFFRQIPASRSTQSSRKDPCRMERKMRLYLYLWLLSPQLVLIPPISAYCITYVQEKSTPVRRGCLMGIDGDLITWTNPFLNNRKI